MTVADSIDAQGGILVAHDGSAAAGSALRTAVSWAESFKTHVTVVRAWSLVTAPRPDGLLEGVAGDLVEDAADAERGDRISPLRPAHELTRQHASLDDLSRRTTCPARWRHKRGVTRWS